MGDGRLGDVAACAEVAGTDRPLLAQLAQDGQAGGIGGSLEELDVGIGRALHERMVLTNVYFDKYQYHDTGITAAAEQPGDREDDR